MNREWTIMSLEAWRSISMGWSVRQVSPDDPTVNEISPDDLMGPYPAVRYNSLDGTMSVDIVTHLGEAFLL
jgi:hypothetical protein